MWSKFKKISFIITIWKIGFDEENFKKVCIAKNFHILVISKILAWVQKILIFFFLVNYKIN